MVDERTSKDLDGSWRSERRGREYDTVVQPERVMETEHDSVLRDPVSHEPVDSETARWRSFFAGKIFYFSSAESKQIFDEDPELWAPVPHASVNSAAIDPLNGKG